MEKRQLQLFDEPGFEIVHRGKKTLITYHKPHTMAISNDDSLLLKYEMTRLVLSHSATLSSVAKQFGVTPSTLSVYCHHFKLSGLAGLLPRKRLGVNKRKDAKLCREVYQLFKKYPQYSPRKIHFLLKTPDEYSYWRIKRLIRQFKSGESPGTLYKNE